MLRKTAGLVDVLRDALLPLAGQVEQAFVYGSMARGDEHAHSDVDLMLIGDLAFADAALALHAAQATLRREVNPTVLSRACGNASNWWRMVSQRRFGAAPSCG